MHPPSPAIAAMTGAWGWWVAFGVFAVLAGVGVFDLVQTRYAVLRNYPLIGHGRYLLLAIAPEIRQYFTELDEQGRPFPREIRELVAHRAEQEREELPFGTELDVESVGYEFGLASLAPLDVPDDPPRVVVGNDQCTKPYSMALLNVSAMSFGSLSGAAIEALNKGAAMGGFCHDTGEGSISPYHAKHGGDLVWEVASGYFGTRHDDGSFDPEQFTDQARDDQVRTISIKLSQGAKPGLGGVMPASKVNEEIAETRGVPQGEICISPPTHSTFSTPVGLLEWMQDLRERSGGKPVGVKLCIGYPWEFLGIVKAALQTGIIPDFVIVDGSEGGTGAAPGEFEDHIGMALTDGLLFVHNALVATGLRDDVRIGASGKVATGFDMVRRFAQGADYCNAARTMMFAVGCIQAMRCDTNTCPTGVATQDPVLTRSLVVPDKAQHVVNYQRATVHEAVRLMTRMGAATPRDVQPWMLYHRLSPHEIRRFDEVYDYLPAGYLLNGPGGTWGEWWDAADPDSFQRHRRSANSDA